MFGSRISTVLASGVLLLGSGAIALAQGGPPDELPAEAAAEAQDQLDTLELGSETATNAVEQGGEGGATAFSEWVRSLELDGCERGLTIAANARTGPTDFDAEDAVEVDPEHPALQAGCADGGEVSELENAEGGLENRPDDARDRGQGPDTAADRSNGASSNAEGAGPPEDAGPAGDAGPSGDAGPPSDAGPPNGR